MAKNKQVEVFVLVDIYINRKKVPAGSVLVIDEKLAQGFGDNIDTHKEAVEYAKNNGAIVIDYDSLVEAAQAESSENQVVVQ